MADRKLTPQAQGCKGQGARFKGQDKRCKGQDQQQRKSVRDAATTFSYDHHHHRPGPTQHDAAIAKATCVRAHKFLTNPYASCSDCCIVLGCSWSVVVVVVVECYCCIPYQLALMLVGAFAPCDLTFAPCDLTFAPCDLTFEPYTCGVILLSTSSCTPLTPLACMVVVSPVPTCAGGLAHILHFSSSNFHCVVVVRSCIWIWRWYIHTYARANTCL